MNLRSWIRKLFAPRTNRTIRKARPQARLGIESLEVRVVPADLNLLATALTPTGLRLRQSGDELQIVNTANPADILASAPAAFTDRVLVEGNGFNINLTVDATVQPVRDGIVFDGGSGINTLSGPNAGITWHVTGNGSGDLGGPTFVRFSGVERLNGAGGSADTFVLGPDAQFTGILDGGTGTTDTLVGPDVDNTWSLTGRNAGTLRGTTFLGMDNLTGGSGPDRFVITDGDQIDGRITGGGGDNTLDYSGATVGVTVDLGVGTASGTQGIGQISRVVGGQSSADVLVGPSGDATWDLNGVNEGTVNDGQRTATFNGVENLTGAAGNTDTFVITPGDRITGTIDGGASGADRLVFDTGSDRVTFAPTGGTIGAVTPFGATFHYRGMDPYRRSLLELNDFSDARNVQIGGDPLAANGITVSAYSAPNLVRVNRGDPADDYVFLAPAESLKVVMGGLRDNVLTIGSPVGALVLPGSLLVDGGGLHDRVTIAGPLTLQHGDLIIDPKTGTSDIDVNAPLTLLHGSLTIDNHLGFALTVGLHARTEVHGDVTIQGGIDHDTIVVDAPLVLDDQFGPDAPGNLLIDGAVSEANRILSTDSVTLNADVTTNGGDITVKTSDITVGLDGNPVVLDTTSTPRDGGILLDGQAVTIGEGVKLLTGTRGAVNMKVTYIDLNDAAPVAVEDTPNPSITLGPDTEIHAGAISLIAHKISQLPLVPFSIVSQKHHSATITLTGAKLFGSTVLIQATTEDKNVLESPELALANNLVIQPLLGAATGALVALIPNLGAVSVQQRAAEAGITLTDTTITSTGDVAIEASSAVASKALAVAGYDAKNLKSLAQSFAPYSAGYSRAEGTATAEVSGNSVITSEHGSVAITSNAETEASVQALTAANAGRKAQGKLSVPAAAVAVTESDTTSKATVGADVRIIAGKNVTVSATADVTNKARSGNAVFGDGFGGLGLALGRDSTTVLAQVDGRITAGGVSTTRQLDQAQIDDQADTITIPDHGLTDGQRIQFYLPDPDDPDKPLAQMTPETFYVIVVDEDTIQLAGAPSIELDATGLRPDIQNTLSRRADRSVSAAAVNTATDAIALSGHGFFDFQSVTVATDAAWNLQGLGAQGDYLVNEVDPGHFQLLTRVRENAGANPQLFPGTGFYIVDFTDPPSGTPAGTLALGYDEAPIEFNAVAAVQGNTLEVAGHGLNKGDVVTYRVVQDPQQQTTVDVSRSGLFATADSDFTFKLNGTDTVVADNMILLPGGHPYVTGQRVQYAAVGGPGIGGLSAGGIYYVIAVDDDRIQLADSLDKALRGEFRSLTPGGTGEHRLRGGAVNLVDDLLVINDHMLQTGQQVKYLTDGGAAVGGLTPQATYYVVRLSDDLVRLAATRQDASAGHALALTSAGGGIQHSLVTNFFVSTVDASQTTPVVNYGLNTIELRGHGLTTGTRVDYDPGDGAPIGGLTAGATYSVIVWDANHIQLASVAAPNDPLDLVDSLLDTGVQELVLADDRAFDFDPLQQATVNTSTNTIWMRNHGFAAGERVTYLTGGGTAIGGLIDGHDYLVLPGTDEHTFRLADPDAPATPLHLTGPGSGSAHGFERASTALRGNSAIDGLEDGATYYVTPIDADHIRLSLTRENADNAGPIDLAVLTAPHPGATFGLRDTSAKAGVNVLASLEAENSAITDNQIGGFPNLSHLLLTYVPAPRVSPVKVKSPAPVTVSGATAINNYVHNVDAVVSKGAVLRSASNVTVDAASENFSRAIANAKVITPKKGTKVFALGSATALGLFENNVHATVGAGPESEEGTEELLATVIDAGKAFTVTANLSYPDLTKFLPFHPDRYAANDPSEGNWMTDAGTALNGRGGLDQMFSVWANTTTTALKRPPQVSIVGSLALADYTNVAEALIGRDTQINQTVQTDLQTVEVSATTTMDVLNLAGQIKLELEPLTIAAYVKRKNSPLSPLGNQAGVAGIGGSALLQLVDNTTTARIEDGVAVHTGEDGLQVTATENVSSVNLAQSGGVSGIFGVSGSTSVVDYDSTTHAEIVGGSQIVGGPVGLSSVSDVNYINAAGAVLLAGNFGVGISAAVNRFNRNTAAAIDRNGEGEPATIEAEALSLAASSTGNIVGVAVSGAAADSTTAVLLSNSKVKPLPAAVAVAGSVSINEVKDITKSYIGGAGVTLAGGDLSLLSLESLNDTRTIAVAGSLAFAARGLVAVGLAGAFGVNTLNLTTESYLDGTRVTGAKSARLDADRSASVFAVTVSMAATVPTGGTSFLGFGITVDVASSVSLNRIVGPTRAYVSGGLLLAAEAVSVTATDTSGIKADGGGVAIAVAPGGGFGVTVASGSSVAVNELTGEVTARITGAQVGAGAMTVAAESTSAIDALTFAGAALAGLSSGVGLAFSGAGAGSGNTIHNIIKGAVEDSHVVAASLALKARDDSEINARAVAAGAAIQVGGQIATALSVGGSATVNVIGNTVDARIQDAEVTTTGGIRVEAIESARTTALSVGAAAALAAAIGQGAAAGAGVGAVATNTTTNVVTAAVTDSDATVGQGGLLIRADDTSAASADAGGGAVAVAATFGKAGVAVAVGAVVAKNEVTNTVSAVVDDADVISGGDVVVAAAAQNQTHARATAVAFAVGVGIKAGVGLAGGGASATNDIAYTVEGAVKANSTVTAEGDVRVTAADESAVDARVEAAATAGGTLASLATGVSVTDNTITNAATARVDDSSVTATHGDLTISAVSAGSVDAAAVTAGVSVATLISVVTTGATANSTVTSTADAHARNAVLSAGGATSVLADSDRHASADSRAGGGALLGGISVMTANAHVGGTTKAFLDQATTVTTEDLTVRATSDNEALIPLGLSLIIGGVGGAGAGAGTTVDQLTVAYVGNEGPDRTVVNARGKVTVEAESTSTATSDVGGGALAGFHIDVFLNSATIEGATRAFVGPWATVNAGALGIHADAIENADAGIITVGAGVIGGTGAKASAVIDTLTEAYAGMNLVPISVGPGTNLTVTGAVNVVAESQGAATAAARGGTFDLLQVDGMIADAHDNGRTKAYLGLGTTVHEAGSLTVAADGRLRADSATTAVSVGVISGNGANALATVGSSDASADTVAAFLAAGTVVNNVTGAVVVRADTDAWATASTGGGTGAVVGVSAMLAGAEENTVTAARIDTGADLTAASLEVVAHATQRRADADLLLAQVNLLAGGGGGNSHAGVNGKIEALAGGSGSDLATDGALVVRAENDNTEANSSTRLGAGALYLNVAGAFATAVNDNTTRAEIRSGTDVIAGDVEVFAGSSDRASASGLVVGVGTYNGQGVKAEAIVTPTTTARVGDDVRITSADDVAVTALTRVAKGNANAVSVGAGGISIGIGIAELNVSPTVIARIGSRTTVTAGGDVSVKADLVQPQSALDDLFVQSSAVDVKKDTIKFEKHGLQTGDTVVYDANEHTPIRTSGGDLESLTREYPVIRLDDDTLLLGETFTGQGVDLGSDPFFAPGGVDSARDVISFGRPHSFKTGDAVRYDKGGNPTRVGGLNEDAGDTGIFYVRVIDDRTIKLTKTAEEANAPQSEFDVHPDLITGGNRLNIDKDFANNDRVTYRAPSRVEFNSRGVDFDDDHPDIDNDIIFLGADADGDGEPEPLARHFRTGDKVQYFTTNTLVPIQGLLNERFYYVIKLDDFRIRLASTRANAENGVALELGANKSGPGAAVRHVLVPVALGGLRDGVTYTVSDRTDSSFQLKDPAGNLVTGLTLGEATGTHFFTKEGGVNLTATTGDLPHSLHIDFIGEPVAATNKLLGARGVSLRVLHPTADGPSTASARGGAFAFIGVDVPTAHVTFGSRVQASSAAALVEAAGDVAITSNSGGSVSATADTKGGGFVTIGAAKATVDYVNVNNAFVGTAVGNINNVTKETDAPQVTAAGVRILAGGDLRVVADSKMRTHVHTTALGVGFIGVSDARGENHLTSHTNVLVGTGADLQARSVAASARVTRLLATADTAATAGGFAGGATATSENDIHSTTNVLLEGVVNTPSRIDGRQGVDVQATHGEVIIDRNTFTKWYGLFGGTSDHGANKGELNNTADADAGVRVSAAARPTNTVLVTDPDQAPRVESNVAVFVLAKNESVEVVSNEEKEEHPEVEQKNNIQWDADITVYAGPLPELVISADARVITAVNVTVNGLVSPAAGTDLSGYANISVADIQAPRPGKIVFQAADKVAGGNSIINGHQWGTFHFSDGFEGVRITNASDKDLVLHSVTAAPRSPSGQTPVIFAHGGSELHYALDTRLLPTVIEVSNLGAGDILLTDGEQIDNPIGETHLQNSGGGIVTGPLGTFVIRTRQLGDPLQPSTAPVFPNLASRYAGLVTFADGGAAPDTITRSDGGSWLAAGFRIGDLIQVEGAHNAGVYRIADVSGANNQTLTLHGLDNVIPALAFAKVTHFNGLLAGGGSIARADSPLRVVLVKDDATAEHLYAQASGDVFLRLTAEFPTDSPSNTLVVNTITAGGDVDITLDQVVDPTFVFELIEAGGDIRLRAADGAPRINVRGTVDVLGSGHLDVHVNGDIDLTEFAGDLRAGSITSTEGNVNLTAPGSIIDALGDAAADVTGVNLTLTAQSGGLGEVDIDLDIDSSNGSLGLVTATASAGVYLNETAGDLNVAAVVSQTGDVRLTADGSILDAADDPEADVLGNAVTLLATHGSVGATGNDLEIDSAFSGPGVLSAAAGGSVYLTEAQGSLSVALATAATGDVRLTVPDLLSAGQDLHVLAGAAITAGASVLLRAGDDVDTAATSVVTAGTTLDIVGDYLNADAGTGTTIDLGGRLTPGSGANDRVAVLGNGDDDFFTFRQTLLLGQAFALGGGGQDTFVVNQLQTMTTSRPYTDASGTVTRRDTLDLDGQAGSDTYLVNTTGSVGSAPSDYVVNVLDSGASADGVDTLTVNGGDQADLFLLRRTNALVGRPTANAPAFVALLHGTVAQARTHTLDPHVERINYDVNVNGLTVGGLGGDDTFASDDNSAATTLDGGAGKDTFQIGQLFGTARAFPDVAAEDAFATTATTRGRLSRGVSFATAVNGGTGNDEFSVYGNKAALQLNGDGGDDTFVVRAFALADQGGASPTIPVLYNVNAHVAIDGGDNFDTLAVLGTELDDNFAITDAGIHGVGVNVSYIRIEALEVNGLEGDDTFFILSTGAGLTTRTVGHLGSDTQRVSGDVTLPVISTANPAGSPLMTFPAQTHVVSPIRGPLQIEGYTGDNPDRALVPAIVLPTETDSGPHSLNLPPVDEGQSLDRLDVFNDMSATNDTGTLTGTTLTGLGMGSGITYHDVEILDVLLGTGDDQFTVNGTLAADGTHGGITLVQGGGGSDTILVNGGGGTSSPLVVFGDTSQDGQEYSGTVGTTSPYGTAFANPGNDVIDARNIATAIIVYGGPGNDVIHGSQGDDRIAGGSGDDVLSGQGGNDLVHGDDGVNVDLVTRVVTVATFAGSIFPAGDGLAAGSDQISGDSGNDVLFGDHGIVVQSAGTLAVLTTGNVIRVETANEADGRADVLRGDDGNDRVLGGHGGDDIQGNVGNDLLFGDQGLLTFTSAGTPTLYESRNTNDGAADVVHGNAGDDFLFGGAAGDSLYGETGRDVAFGDQGRVQFVGGLVARLETTNPQFGGGDAIQGNEDDDVLFGGFGNDTLDAGAGNHVLLGDDGFVDYAGDGNLADIDEIASTSPTAGGGSDEISATGGTDIILGGRFGDVITAGDGTNVVIGDSGRVVAAAADAPRFGSLSITLGLVETTAFGDGGDDTVTTGNGQDIVLGGHANDTLTVSSSPAPDDHNIVLGDDGFLRFDADSNPADLDEIASTSTALGGGSDVIVTAGGDDLILGGRFGDLINAGDGTNVVLGDSGRVVAAAADTPRFGSLPITLGLVTTTQPDDGGADVLTTGAGRDFVLAGPGGDGVTTGASNDIVLGDAGFLDWVALDPSPANLDIIRTTDPTFGGNDTLDTGAGNDLVLAGTAGDTVRAGDGNDLVFGDHGDVRGDVEGDYLPLSTLNKPFTFTAIATLTADLGGNDVVYAGAGRDIALGQQGDDLLYGEADDDDLIGGHNVAGGHDGRDTVDGGAGHDVLTGDNAAVLRRGDALTPRVRGLAGATIYDAAGAALVAPDARPNPTGVEARLVTLLDHSSTPAPGTFGDDVIAGGAGDDVIFGQLGDDTIQGDGEGANPFGATRAADGTLVVTPVAESEGDGDDYIEGNGGADVVFGGLGQDDLVGGSSSLFSLTTADLRLDGSDVIFGGSGAATGRNHAGDTSAQGHARDADYILGDNGNVYRLVGANGAFLTFNYDNYGPSKLIPRAVTTLDYTPGSAGSNDIGTADYLHGESGDDFLHGQVGNDVIFGEGQDDQLIGGAGLDRIYGGTGEDSVAGDDARFNLSRNGLTEPLYGVTVVNAQANIELPGPFTGAWIYITGRLNSEAHLLSPTVGGNDLIYGGQGDDFLHAGAGDDGVSGAEAQAAWYNDRPVGLGFYQGGGYTVNFNGVAVNPANPLGYDPATRKLAAYDANNPLTRVNGFFLNFDAAVASNKVEDGKDRLFGDDGHDWLVGGTGNDRLFGGKGDDQINADDNHDTAGGLNNQPDAPLYADRDFVYGGDGLDVMIANTGGDRLFDWGGEFNSFVVPFSAFGAPTVNRSPSPQIQQFLLALGREGGADGSLAEPNGELGLFTQQDPQWGANHGAPRDPQPGNVGGSSRDTQGGPEDDRGPGGNSGDVTVGRTFLSADPSAPNQLALFVGGTTGDDTIVVRRGATSAYLEVVVNGVSQGQFAVSTGGASVGRILVHGHAGNDTITINPNVGSIDAVLLGGAGNDTITGGTGSNLLDGGAGNDLLTGNASRDVLFGGLGTDTLNAGDGDDLLVGGVYRYSEDLDAALWLLSEWKRSANYNQRIARLRAGATDGLFALSLATVLDDGVADRLNGNQGQDWFWSFPLDQDDRSGNETNR